MDSFPHLKSAVRYCDMGRSPIELAADWILGRAEPKFSGDAGRTTVFTQSGRAAIALAARLWKLGPDDEVLVPAYHCGSEVSPLIATGARVLMYRIDDHARIDVNDLLQRVTSRTRLIHVIHYFGWPADLSELVTYCRSKDIKLLEDCALSLFSDGTGQNGDAAIFSLRKSLPVCDGGILSLQNSDDFQHVQVESSTRGEAVRGLLSLMKKWSLRLGRFVPEHQEEGNSANSTLPKGLPPLPDSYYWTVNSVIAGASRFSLGLLNRTDPLDMVRRRRDNYLHLRKSIDSTPGIEFLWEESSIPDRMCPLGLPILVDDRQRWCKTLNSAGIIVSPWWDGCHSGLNWTEFPEARELKSKLLLLPVHQQLDATDIDYIARLVRSLTQSKVTLNSAAS